MRQFKYILKSIFPILLLLSLGGCTDDSDIPDFSNDNIGNFDALSHIIETKYCFLTEKGLDWQSVTKTYRARVKNDMPQTEFFDLCSEMLAELKDGHVNLSSPFSTSYYRRWWSDYPQDFNIRTLQQYYLDFDYYSVSGIYYKVLDNNIGYMYYPSFSTTISPTALDYILLLLSETDGLIIDIRNNGGGVLTNIDTLVGRFIEEEITGGSIVHKNGPAINDFSEPFTFTYNPAGDDRIKYIGKPIALLTNRSCYSAANAFTAVMRSLPQVTQIGGTTGGGAGLPFTSELPNGWSVRFSASPVYAPDGSLVEFGISPLPQFCITSPDEELSQGKDAILEAAINNLTK